VDKGVAGLRMEGANDDEKKISYRSRRGFLGMPTVKGGLRLRPRL